jgi:hypothetical protein
MLKFNNISNVSNIQDYLPILNAVIITDLVFQIALYTGVFRSRYLAKWYADFHWNAFLADVMIIVIGFVLTRYFYYKVF